MLHRLRDLLAHARAAHRIGCVRCDRDERARLVLLGMDFEQRVQKAIANSDARLDIVDPDEPPADFGQQDFIPGPDK